MKDSSRKKRINYLHFGRYGEILSILVKYGFGDVISTLNIEKYLSLTKKIFLRSGENRIVKKVSRWERIRYALEELGPTFIKFGQFLSNRPDLVPRDLVPELEKLQDAVKSFSSADARRIIEEELKQPLSAIVKDFNDKPIASASIAQVHKAVLKDGTEVAMKVQRPNIRQSINTDIEILFHLVSLIEKRYDWGRALHLTQMMSEFESILRKELDFTIEASHIDRFRIDFKNDPYVYVPLLYDDYTTKRLLVTEFIHGVKVSNIEGITRLQLDTKEIAKNGTHIILRQIFDHGFFHADPHPGNILIKPDGKICFLDFGAVGIVPPTLRYHLSIILYGVVHKDSQRIVRTLMQLTDDRIKNIERLEYDVTEFIEEYSLALLRQIDIGVILRRFSNMIIAHDLKIVPGFYLLLKALIAIEGVGTKLNPDFCMTEYIEPYVKKLIRENPRLRHLPFDVYFTTMDMASLVKDLPFDLKDMMRLVKSGNLTIQFEHRGLEPMLTRNDQIVNRLVFALVLAALIIGSSVVVHSGVPPIVFGLPLIGIVGFVLAVLIGFSLLFSIVRHKKM